jgi:hypothetical protein
MFITLLNRISVNTAEVDQVEFYTSTSPTPIDIFVYNQEKQTLVDNFSKAIKVQKDLATISNYLGGEENE